MERKEKVLTVFIVYRVRLSDPERNSEINLSRCISKTGERRAFMNKHSNPFRPV